MKNNKNNNATTSVMGLLLVLMVGLSLFFLVGGPLRDRTLTANEFGALINDREIVELHMTPRPTVIDVEGQYKTGEQTVQFSSRIPNSEQQLDTLTQKLTENKIPFDVADPNPQLGIFWQVVLNIVPLIFMGLLMFYMFSKISTSGAGQSKAFDFSKSQAKAQSNIRVRFDDVAGAEEEKQEMKELIDYLREPKKFESMGARIPKGVLLQGAPGTGKTLLAKAVAGEADVPFYSISGSDFVEMFVGVGASRVRDMFRKAKSTTPCILFIDEIDAVGRRRSSGTGSGGNEEREQTLNQLLVEMDGMEDNSGIIIIAATNRSDVLDPALLRPGRFDRTITVSLPDVKARKEILEVHARNKRLAPDADLSNIAKRTPTFAGADLENVLNEAAILAVREDRNAIHMDDLDEAIDRVMMGPAKVSRRYTEDERRMVAFHEAGHAVVGLKLDGADKVQKVTIIPRGEAGGYNLMTPQEETFTSSRSRLIGRITGYMGGRVAEEIVFGDISTGASGDIQSATKIARSMVMYYGMSDLGPIQYLNGAEGAGANDFGLGQNYSSEIAFKIDEEVRKFVDEAYKHATKIISANMELLNKIVDALLEYETITAEQIQNIVEGRKADDFGSSSVSGDVVSAT